MNMEFKGPNDSSASTFKELTMAFTEEDEFWFLKEYEEIKESALGIFISPSL